MATYNFSNITPAVVSASKLKPGYSDTVTFAPIAEFTTIAAPGAYSSPGDKKKITTAHTFAVGKGFSQIKAKSGRVRQEGTTAVGEVGGWVPSYKYGITIKGHSAVIEEIIEEMMNEEFIFLFNSPECGVNEYEQLGSSCNPAKLESFANKSGNKGEGGTCEFELVFASSDHYFYSGTVTLKS